MRANITVDNKSGAHSMNSAQSWMIYGASGYTGALIAQHASESGHRPVLAGRSAPAVRALAEKLDLPYRVLALDDPAALHENLNDIDLVLNAAGPFLHTATPLAEASLGAEAHYVDISNELQVFRSLYDLDQRARAAHVAIIPGVGFGVVATNCLARYVSEAVGGAQHLEVATKAASGQQGPGVPATRQENLPYGGWIRQAGQLHPYELGSGITTVSFPDGAFQIMPIPTGDLEAAFQATGSPNVVSYMALVDPVDDQGTDEDASGPPTYRSFGWARATGSDGATVEAWLETGDSYTFTPAASVRAVEELLSTPVSGALSPAAAFGANFAFTVKDTTRIDIP
jgi:short subunit dehydrogenase-like uncharacterized protein